MGHSAIQLSGFKLLKLQLRLSRQKSGERPASALRGTHATDARLLGSWNQVAACRHGLGTSQVSHAMAGSVAVISEAPVTQWKQQIKRLSESHAWQEATKLLLDLRAEKLEVDGEIFGAIIHAGTSAQAWNVALRSVLEMTEVDLVTGLFCKASNILKVVEYGRTIGQKALVNRR